jgi:hypothetical protein
MKKTNVVQDELSRTRRRVKYLLLWIGFEQNMIDAYSSEGWKGQRFVNYQCYFQF